MAKRARTKEARAAATKTAPPKPTRKPDLTAEFVAARLRELYALPTNRQVMEAVERQVHDITSGRQGGRQYA